MTDSTPLRVHLGLRPEVDYQSRRSRLALSPIARARWDDRFDETESQARYGPLRDQFTDVALDEAEVAVLPLVWEHADRREALDFIDRARGAGRWTVVFAGSDFEPVVPAPQVVLAHAGPQPHRRSDRHVMPIPYFPTVRELDDLDRAKPGRPVVSFCGQASASPVATAGHAAQRAWWHARWRLGRSPFVPPSVGGHLRLRAQAIRLLRDDPRIDDRFIVRDRYRAGAEQGAGRERAEREFWDNLRDGDYALCVRGSGNFSARFYEALSLGRIPVLVDTDCQLPASELVDWDELIIRVDRRDLERLPESVAEEHDRMTSAALAERKRACFETWQRHLSSDGFFASFRQHLESAGWTPPGIGQPETSSR